MLSIAISLAMSLTAMPEPSEALRPQYHFTAPKGWLNDPNGLVFYKGEYHFFYQHNPFSTQWGNMTWGHAVSKDLLHWQHLPNALEPDAQGTMFSGSAVVDWENTSGFGTKANPPMVMFYTAAGGTNEASKGVRFSQGLAYSTDGRTFTKYKSNPIVSFIENENRDPKVIWHAPSKSWIMALYLDGDRYSLFRSSDLKTWKRTGKVTIPGSSECPDIFELPVVGKSNEKLWVFWSANGRYRLGEFDGTNFVPLTNPMDSNFGPNCYAAQTYSDEPKGRRVQISWMRGGNYPDSPFNQQMTIPRELKLRSTRTGPRLSLEPVSEMTSLRSKTLYNQAYQTSEPLTIKTPSELVEIRVSLGLSQDAKVQLGERTIEYDAASRTLRCQGHEATIMGKDGKFDLIAYLDRTSLEIFADQGFVSMPFCFVPKAPLSEVVVTGKSVSKLQIYSLKAAI